MLVYAAMQQELTGRVYTVLSDNDGYYWLRSSPGQFLHGPFPHLDALCEDMAACEGRTPGHWAQVLAQFHPSLPYQRPGVVGLSV